jgi:hypothetical protein
VTVAALTGAAGVSTRFFDTLMNFDGSGTPSLESKLQSVAGSGRFPGRAFRTVFESFRLG